MSKIEKIDKNSTKTTHFIYDGAKLIGEYNSDGSVKNEYIYLDNIPVGVIPRGYPQDGVKYILPDHLGTPRRLADENANIVWSWESEPFGDDEAVGSVKFNLRFAGQYFDDETSTHYNINRDYNPKTGRYIESDPIGFDGGVNSYGYVAGNPLVAVDEMGLKIKFKGISTHVTLFKKAYDKLNKTPTGNVIIKELEKRKMIYTIQKPTAVTNYSSAYASNGVTGEVYIDPERTAFLGVSGKKWELVRKSVTLAHELGHAMGTAEDDGSGTNMLNVNTWENPVRIEMGLPLRKTYKDPSWFRGVPIAYSTAI